MTDYDKDKYDKLEVSVVGRMGRWEVLLEVNGKEWKRFGPWADLDTAQMYCQEALARANKVRARYPK